MILKRRRRGILEPAFSAEEYSCPSVVTKSKPITFLAKYFSRWQIQMLYPIFKHEVQNDEQVFTEKRFRLFVPEYLYHK